MNLKPAVHADHLIPADCISPILDQAMRLLIALVPLPMFPVDAQVIGPLPGISAMVPDPVLVDFPAGLALDRSSDWD